MIAPLRSVALRGAGAPGYTRSVPAGIEFECPHCQRVTKVPVTLAGKQGRCAGCRKVLEVPAGVPASGRTPDPEDGLLEVLDARRASERVRRPSDRVAGLEAARPSERVPSAPRRSDQGPVPGKSGQGRVSGRSGQGRVPGKSGQGRVAPDLDDVPAADDDEGSTTSVPAPAPPAPGSQPFLVWARKVPLRIWLGLPAAVVFPALGIALCVLGLRKARERGEGERMAKWGIGIGSAIMLLNLAYLAHHALFRPGR